jgi:hypothetical protein
MRKISMVLAVLIGLAFAASASAVNRSDLIACMLGQQPEGVVCPVP